MVCTKDTLCIFLFSKYRDISYYATETDGALAPNCLHLFFSLAPNLCPSLSLQTRCPDFPKGWCEMKYWAKGGIEGFGQDVRGSPRLSLGGERPKSFTLGALGPNRWIFQCPCPLRVAETAVRGTGSAAKILFENYLPAGEFLQQLSLIQIKSLACVRSNFSSVGPVVIILHRCEKADGLQT